MLHPDLDDLIRLIRQRGMMAGLITNGYFLVPKRIEELNEAGLDFLQISIDNVEPDEVSKKSLRVLDKKLQHLRDHAEFDVNINSVLGGGIKNAGGRADDQPRARGARLLDLHRHHPRRLGPAEAARPGGARGVRRCLGGDQRAVAGVQEPLLGHHELPGEARRRPAERVAVPRRRALPLHLRRGPRPLLLAAARHARRAARVLHRSTTSAASSSTPKWCAPYCTVGCVHRVSTMDFWRSPQELGSRTPVSSRQHSRSASGFSRSVRLKADATPASYLVLKA